MTFAVKSSFRVFGMDGGAEGVDPFGRHVRFDQGNKGRTEMARCPTFLRHVPVGVLEKAEKQSQKDEDRCRGKDNLEFKREAHG